MLEFKRVNTAAVTISAIKVAAKITKHQFKIGELPGRSASMPAIWAALLVP